MLRHQLGTSERPVVAEFIKTAIVGIDFIIAKSFQKGCFRIIVNLQIHNDLFTKFGLHVAIPEII